MDLSSWFRNTLLRNNKSNPVPTESPTKPKSQLHLQQDEELGITDELQSFIKSFTLETFKSYPLQDEQLATTTTSTNNGSSVNTERDLSEWQERHATLVLSRVKEIAKLRYLLCPRHLKERQFWRIYFALVKSYITPYEIHSIQKAKLRRTEQEDNKPQNSACEVEMSEAKGVMHVTPSS